MGQIKISFCNKIIRWWSLQFFTDITEMKKNEAELERLKKGIDILPNGLMFWDKDDFLIAHNQKCYFIFKTI